MEYSIGELAAKMHLSPHTLRYYEEERLLRHIRRLPSGRRVYTEEDVVMLHTIECLKKAGLSIRDIRQYIDWCEEGFSTAEKRYELFVRKEQEVLRQLEDLKQVLATVQWKKEFYRQCLERGEIAFDKLDKKKMAELILRGDEISGGETR